MNYSKNRGSCGRTISTLGGDYALRWDDETQMSVNAHAALLYRERGDCENIFEEMKNQWGWSGFTAHSLKQTALFAGIAVIAANLWNIFTRLGSDGTHREAVFHAVSSFFSIDRLADIGE